MPGSDLRLLALDGGGVRGLSALMILEQLMEAVDPDAPPKPCDYFDIISGTSTGGLIAVMLGRLRMSLRVRDEQGDERDCLPNELQDPTRQQRPTQQRDDIGGLPGDLSSDLLLRPDRATETEVTAERFWRERGPLDSTGRYYRFNVARGLEDIRLEEAKKVKEIAAATRRYISSQEVHGQMQACAGSIARREYFREHKTIFTLESLARPNNTAWLLIFDNVDREYTAQGGDPNAYDVRRYLSGADHGSVLVTTRLAQLEQLGESQQLGKVSTAQGQAILESWYKRKHNAAESEGLLALLDGLPLAIAQAGAYLQESGVGLATYLRFYEQQ
ncbi:hypothetical protein AA0113_g12747 [Alternaria arborescens]|uniref:PNPLA domain-containing protein n=1 Tax=Alternaria arborescens TaxID=156630 RepID=A0A4Q4PW56_9PLEO|nr:hypothetical protein AA0113_g12747 [Alternaria arborescens]